MEIRLQSIYKRFSQHWVIKDVTATFQAGVIYGISGPNGSGKTTLLQIMAGLTTPSKGTIEYISNGRKISDGDWYQSLSFAAPYAELFDYLTLEELVRYHSKLKPFYDPITVESFIDICYLNRYRQQFIKSFSSGMKQRLKLAFALLSKSEVVFLDEPVSNLDEAAKEWYFDLLGKYKQDRIVVIASNEEEDFQYSTEMVGLLLN